MTLNHVRWALSVVVCAVPLQAGEPPAHQSIQPSNQVTAAVLPEGRYSMVALREMGREAANILKESGVSLHWHLGTPTQSVSGLLVVVKLLGQCDMDGPRAFLQPGPLGWAHEVNGAILPFSDLACDNIRGAVQSAFLAGNQAGGNVLLGRAMGRVLAHELYHIVAGTSRHGRDGVAQGALSPRELTSGQLELRPAEVAAVQSGLSRR
jgi:hypothetical protein